MATFNDQTFGAELEFYLPAGATKQALADAIGRRLGQPVTVEGYTHATRPTWKIVTDASLSDSVRGAEIVSPILRGEAGLQQLATVCDTLSDFGCTVAKSCGFHIHVGAQRLTIQQHRNLVRIYQAYEAVIDAMMPPSRRGSDNTFCRSLAAATSVAINAASNPLQLARAIRPGVDDDNLRYTKLNFMPYAAFLGLVTSSHRIPTVEFRQHSGTLEARKAVMWARCCVRMVVAAIELRDVQVTTTAQINKARPNTKAYAIGEMFLRPEGVTAPEVLAVTGWPAVSMPQQAKQAGLQVTKQRRGRVVRYFASRAEAQAPVQFVRTLQGFCTLLNLTPEEAAYFRTRAENLSGPVAWTA